MNQLLKHWQFIFAIVGAIVTATGMFGEIKNDLAAQKTSIKYIRRDIAIIKEKLDDSKSRALSIGLAGDSVKNLH